MSWPDRERYLRSPQSLVVSLLLSLVSALVSSRTGSALSHEILRHTGSLDFYRGTYARCVLSRLRCIGLSLLLSCYLSRIGRIENPCCSTCGHSSQDISHLILHCPATDSLRRSLFGDSLSLYDLWSRPWGIARLLGLCGISQYPIPQKGLGKQQDKAKVVRMLNFYSSSSS